MKKVVVMAVFAIITLSIVSCGEKVSKDTTTEQTAKEPKEGDSQQLAYQCPMDCEDGKTYDKPGKCPVCEMDLVEVKAGQQ
ncbi:hypothetical protein FLJC2902T_22190 [Flavobacterium limnosediminis JC2902]|uniref:Heavy metal binding domain-containing protein n=1 Tax=Flavobacterium limnosediminis JC2902 TaxID=1341181 RepID=V6SKI1_9FLAO|nr:heavy metal-binding domain-containing protein [Flavobacterium limnosediminis]ESU27111.1 hypothetical protein FLJC2902T_22190 [Flavobacterium limnosediminis JC2902]